MTEDASGPRTCAILALVAAVTGIPVLLIGFAGGYGYDYRHVYAASVALAGGRDPYTDSQFVYPPSLLLFDWPLGRLPFSVASSIMLGVQWAALVVLATASARLVAGAGWRPMAVRLAAALALSYPVLGAVGLLNLSTIVAAMLAAALHAATTGRRDWAAILLGLSLAVKPMLAPLLAVLLVARRWRKAALALGIAAMLVVTALPLLADPWSVVTKALPYLLRGEYGNLGRFNTSFLGLAHVYGIPPLAVDIVRATTAAAAVALAFRVWRRPVEDRALAGVEVTGVILAAAFLVAPLSEYHYALALVPFYASAVRPAALARQPLALAGCAACAVCGYPDLVFGGSFWVQILTVGGFVLTLLGVAVGLRRGAAAVRPAMSGMGRRQ